MPPLAKDDRPGFGSASALGLSARDDSDDERETDEAPVPSEALLAAAGLHHVMANHQRVLADSLYRQFELPLLDEFDKHRSAREPFRRRLTSRRAAVVDRQATYDKSVAEKTKRIRVRRLRSPVCSC